VHGHNFQTFLIFWLRAVEEQFFLLKLDFEVVEPHQEVNEDGSEEAIDVHLQILGTSDFKHQAHYKARNYWIPRVFSIASNRPPQKLRPT